MTTNEVEINTTTSPELERVLAGYARLLRMLTPTRSDGLIDSTLTMAQLKVLMLLMAVDESRMSELASSLQISMSTVSGLVERLVEHGYVTRRTDAIDRRQVMVSLTNEGVAVLDRFQELGTETLRNLLSELSTEELTAVGNSMDLLIAAAERMAAKENL